MQIRERKGKEKGKTGITIQVIDQARRQKSLALTVHGTTVKEAYRNIRTWFEALERGAGGIRIRKYEEDEEWQKKK